LIVADLDAFHKGGKGGTSLTFAASGEKNGRASSPASAFADAARDSSGIQQIGVAAGRGWFRFPLIIAELKMRSANRD
jgi:hypothetical protein